ncbi:MAG: cache domain-containing protein [Candidatus Sulfotelmatobacter sp.]
MKSSRMFAGAVVVLLNVGLCAVAVAQTGATPQEVVAKVKEAASALSKTGDLSQFDQKQGPWVWKDTYIFIQDCNKKVMAAHPIKPEMIGKGLDTVMDAKSGKAIYSDPAAWCKKVEASSTGVWNEYYWPKPGEKEASRKVTYHLAAKGTSYIVSAGIYDDKASLAEVSKMSSMK